MHPRLPIFHALEQGKTIITPNNRLSAELLCDFYAYKNVPVLEKPACFPFQAWLASLFSAFCFANPESPQPLLLSPGQSHFLWTEILEQTQSLSSLSGLIEEVMEAWKRCQRWQIDLNDARFRETMQTQQFQSWAHAFEKRLKALNALDEEQLIDFFIKNHFKPAIKALICYCFEEQTPKQNAWFLYLQAQGTSIEFLDIEAQKDPGARFLYAAANEEEEHQQLLLNIQERLSLGAGRLGVIVPDLENKALALQNLFQQVFDPSLFDISLGKPLLHFPLIAHAFAFLKLKTEALSRREALLLLSSPFLASSEEEHLGRTKALQENEAFLEENISHHALCLALEKSAPKLGKLFKNLKDYPEAASLEEWIGLFAERLRALGFPGGSSLNSENYQAYQRFLGLFEELKTLGFLSPIMSAHKALAAFENLAKNCVFKAQLKAPVIQILGLLEASGCLFDGLWVCNMGHDSLPQKTKLSPFVPAPIQREKAMPRATPERELFLAEKIITRLKNCSEHSVFSYPKLAKDKPNLPSPLLSALDLYAPLKPSAKPRDIALKAYEESYHLTPTGPLRGNSTLLSNQAKCPFRAFAQHRLHAKKPLEVSDGLNALERGKILHKALEELWLVLKDQQSLLCISPDALEALIQQSIGLALKPYQENLKASFSPLIQAIESKRLMALIKASLEWEKTRPPFVVHALEKSFSLDIAGMSFHLRMDRIDGLASGKKWVIDYKSSLAAEMPWREERPKEPQMLLYALSDETINALLFAGLKEGKLEIKGLSEEASECKAISPLKAEENWPDLRDAWQARIEALTSEYREGHCAPKPQSPSICKQCDFQSLCRV